MVTPAYHLHNGDEKMNKQGNAGAYRVAIDAAMNELNLISRETERLRNRMYQLDSVVEVLKSLIGSGEQTLVEDRRPASESIETAAEPVQAEVSTFQPVEIALTQPVPQKSGSADPVQRRINSILGLALA